MFNSRATCVILIVVPLIHLLTHNSLGILWLTDIISHLQYLANFACYLWEKNGKTYSRTQEFCLCCTMKTSWHPKYPNRKTAHSWRIQHNTMNEYQLLIGLKSIIRKIFKWHSSEPEIVKEWNTCYLQILSTLYKNMRKNHYRSSESIYSL